MSTENPFVSLAVICGAEGAKTLGRLLKSVIDRKAGPLVDEIVLCANFDPDDSDAAGALDAALRSNGYPGNGFYVGSAKDVLVPFMGPIRLKLIQQKWEGDFAKARNESYAFCKGEWIMWADTDDLISSADDDSQDGLPAINAVERYYGLPLTPKLENSGSGAGGGKSSLSTYLKSLPYDVNCVMAIYDYTINAHGDCESRQTMRRITRRGSHVWRAADGLHEQLYPCTVLGERAVTNFGLLSRHYPSEEGAVRVARNVEIVKALTKPDVPITDARHNFDLSSVHIQSGDYNAADEALRRAIAKSESESDQYTYRMQRAYVQLKIGDSTKALHELFMCKYLDPARAAAYFGIAEAFFLVGKWVACIKAFEEGVSCPVVPLPVDQPKARFVIPRAQAALAYCMKGEPEKGLAVAQEALSAYPYDELARQAFAKCRADAGKKRTIDGLLDAAQFFLEGKDWSNASDILDTLKTSPLLRGAEALTRYRQLYAQGETLSTAAFEEEDLRIPQPLEELRDAWGKPGPAYAAVNFTAVEATDSKSLMEGRLINVLEIQERDDYVGMVYRFSKKASAIHIYCPAGVTNWDPSAPEGTGTGGSESAVVYLGRALARRGYEVIAYVPGGGLLPKAEKGILWYGVAQFDPSKLRAGRDVLIAHRCPWILKDPRLTVPAYVWHQDNGYAAEWAWSKEIEAKAAGSLHVSEWAAGGLVRELEGRPDAKIDPARHHVIGNGVCADWGALENKAPTRDMHRVVYASDPTRGLWKLLNMWPAVLEQVPGAELHVFGNFEVARALANSNPGSPGILEIFKIQEALNTAQRVHYHGLVGQPALTDWLMKSAVYAYPGGPMPEGYGVALAQAQAAGCRVIAPKSGALPEVLGNWPRWTEPVTDDESLRAFCTALIDELKTPTRPEVRLKASDDTYARHNWERVADRFEKALGLSR